MGWYYAHRPRGMSIKEFIEKESLTHPEMRIVACSASLAKKVCYLAVEAPLTAQEPPLCFGMVYLLDPLLPREHENLGYKPLDEQDGPVECDAPRKVLERLDPTENEFALGWRARCWERLAHWERWQAAKVGQVFRFHSLVLRGGAAGYTPACSLYLMNKRSRIFQVWDGGAPRGKVRLRDETIRAGDWSVLDPEQVEA